MPRRKRKTEASAVAELEETDYLKSEIEQEPKLELEQTVESEQTPEPIGELKVDQWDAYFQSAPSFADWSTDATGLAEFRQKYVQWLKQGLKLTDKDKTYFVDGLGNVRQK